MPTKLRKRPEQKMSEVIGADFGKGLTNKRFTSLKAVKDAAPEGDSEPVGGGAFRPSDKELEQINTFTKSPKTADDVVVLRTMSANDIRDRDLDKFTTDCIKTFAKLPAPMSPTGKPFMVSHDATKLPVGRIFDTSTKRVEDDLFLANSVYMPNTDQYKSFLENVDYGIYWAVSVGVMLGSSTCTVGAPHEFGRWFCAQGHEKGEYYDPSSDEKDDWGWPVPVEQGAKGAVQCGCDFDDPADFYELSQVYLGAQYFAELDKDPTIGPVIKAASSAHPVIGLSHAEAKSLNMQHVPVEVESARKDSTIIETEDGSYRWKTTDDFIYTWDASQGEVLCLGKAAPKVDEPDPVVDPVVPVEEDKSVEPTKDNVPPTPVVDPSKEPSEPMSKKAIQAAARAVKLPSSILDRLAESDDTKALEVFMSAAGEHIASLEADAVKNAPAVKAGTDYLNDLRSAAKAAYVKARQGGDTDKGVDTGHFDKLLKMAGDDIDLIKGLRDEYDDQAKSKFPTAVRRSSFPVDANEPTLAELPAKPKAPVDNDRSLGSRRLAIISRHQEQG